MNLTLKIALTLIVVVTVALTTTALLIERSAGNAYRGYVAAARQGQMQQLAAQSALLYQQTQDWSAVQSWLDDLTGGMMAGAMPGRGRVRGANGAGPWRNAAYLLLDPVNGVALAGETPKLNVDALSMATPVWVDGVEVARLALVGEANEMGPSEQALLTQVRRSIALSALVSAGFALLIGAALMINILRPLRKLESGVAAISRGDLAARVEETGRRDELGRLAANFNHMAASLQEQELLRRRLVSDLAHELRTPLSVVQGNLQALLDGVYPLSRAELQTVYNETELLVRLVHDLHELAQAEAGKLPLALQDIELLPALQHMADLFRPLADKRGVELALGSVPRDLTVRADTDRLLQILHNLIGNALRHTPAGGVVTLQAAPDARDSVRISVTDSGPGILPRDLSHIFDRFYQADVRPTDPDSHTAGAGLGLAIVKALSEAHGGTVGVDSRPGEGATFWFDLPPRRLAHAGSPA